MGNVKSQDYTKEQIKQYYTLSPREQKEIMKELKSTVRQQEQLQRQRLMKQQQQQQQSSRPNNGNGYNPYKILGIDESATPKQISKAYKKLSIKNHPDKGGSEALYKMVVEAYQYLKSNDVTSEIGRYEHMSTEYEDHTNEYRGYENTKVERGSGQGFNAKQFNKIFEENKLEDNNDKGYDSFLRDNDGGGYVDHTTVTSEQQVKFNESSVKNFNRKFAKSKASTRDKRVIMFESPSAWDGGGNLSYSELGLAPINDFSSGRFTDLKKAYTEGETSFLDPTDVEFTTYRNISELERERASMSYDMSPEEANRMRQRKMAEDSNEKRRRARVRDREDLVTRHFEQINQRFIGGQNR